MTQLRVNGDIIEVDINPTMPILWALRDKLGLTGTKFGCGAAQCGACTIHLDGNVTRSCVTPIAAAVGRSITTIEGVATSPLGARVQAAWIKHDVAQCGYCQSGQIMTAVALLRTKPSPSDGDIDDAMAGNICRCGTYLRIRAAIRDAARTA